MLNRKNCFYILYFAGLLCLFFIGGGLIVTLGEEWIDPAAGQLALLTLLAGASLLVAIGCGFRLRRGHWSLRKEPGAESVSARHLAFSTVLFTLLIAASLVLLNLAASFFAVPWPMSGLHGVSSVVGRKAWEYRKETSGFVNVNSWGQRDGEHSLIPRPGVDRILFIGDSMLEDGAPVPLPYRTEQLMNGKGKQYELINLGVTATDPDEYYFRLKRVGLPLRPNRCVLVFSAGTDFIQAPTLLSFGGISATYPRRSFLQILGLNSLDHVISNGRRQVLRAWFKGGDLLQHELELQEIFAKTASDQETENAYLSFFPPNEQAELKTVLYRSSAAERGRFYQMLRHPDGGAFRSYYLDIATKVARGMKPLDFVPADYSYKWIELAAQLCSDRGIKFTLAVIPDGFSVDARMAGQYAALADMKAYMRYKDEATNRLVEHAAAAGMDVADLRPVLTATPGAFQDMDGHLSQAGVDAVAEYLAQRLQLQSSAAASGKQ